MTDAYVPTHELPPIHQFTGMDVWSTLTDTAAQAPQTEFLTWQPFDSAPVHWTYEQFVADCEAVAGGLQERGIHSGDRVVIHMENCPEFLIAWFACAALHAIAVTTNSRSSEDELAYYLSDSGARAAMRLLCRNSVFSVEHRKRPPASRWPAA